MAEILTGGGMIPWVAERLPGQGRILPPTYRVRACRLDGAAYMRTDGLSVIVSGTVESDGKRWLHVSLSRKNRMPSYEDLQQAKWTFIGADNYAVQVFPPADKHVNIHPYCLHLFACLDGWPLPEFSGVIGGVRML